MDQTMEQGAEQHAAGTGGLYAIKMPDLGEGIAEVEIVAWRVQPGDTVREDQILADVMTDKATVEIPSPVAGTVLALGGAVGVALPVGAELIRLQVAGAGNVRMEAGQAAAQACAAPGVDAGMDDITKDDLQGDLQGDLQDGPHDGAHDGTRIATPVFPTRAPVHEAAASGHQRAPGPQSEPVRPLAAPAVRKRAWDLGIELRFVAGTGPAGRITHGDLDAWLAGRGQSRAARGDSRYPMLEGEEAVPVIGLRRRIAERMQLAKRQIPHFTYVEEVDVTELEALRQQLNARPDGQTNAAAGTDGGRGRLTLLPLLMRAVVLAVRRFPEVNARYDEAAGVVTRYQGVHIGIATQTDAGLMVPVVRNAEARDPWQNAAEIARLAEAAHAGKASRDELGGSTITITSLGALGGIVSTPVINHPEVAIVGVNRIVDRPVVRDGGMVARKMMNLSSSFDHRIIDGMVAAQFVQAVRGYLECPALLFVD